MFFLYSEPIIRALGSSENLTATEVDNSQVTQPSPSGHPTYQSMLHSFLPLDSEGSFPFNIDEFAEKVVSKLVQKLNRSIPKHKNPTATSSNSQSTISSDASNLIEYLNKLQDLVDY